MPGVKRNKARKGTNKLALPWVFLWPIGAVQRRAPVPLPRTLSTRCQIEGQQRRHEPRPNMGTLQWLWMGFPRM